MNLEVGCIVKFEERYGNGVFLGQITVDIPVEEMSLYHYYIRTFEDETYGAAGHEVLVNYGNMTKEYFVETYPEKLI